MSLNWIRVRISGYWVWWLTAPISKFGITPDIHVRFQCRVKQNLPLHFQDQVDHLSLTTIFTLRRIFKMFCGKVLTLYQLHCLFGASPIIDSQWVDDVALATPCFGEMIEKEKLQYLLFPTLFILLS